MREITPSTARWLVSDAGRAWIAHTHAALDAGTSELELLERIRREGVAAELASGVLSCARAPARGRLVFTREAAEQASPEESAAWRARRFTQASRILDLCCGAGSDALALARVASTVCVDIDEGRAVLVRHNTSSVSGDAHVVVADALAFPSSGAFVHADPSRRRNGKRIKAAAEYVPPVDRLLDAHASAEGMCVLLSPAVDLDDRALPSDRELEFIQLGNQLVECALWTGALRTSNSATATLLPAGDSIGRAGPPHRLPAGPLGAFLIEPAAAAVRARVHEQLGAEAGMRKVTSGRSLLTCDTDPGPSSWWTGWRVEADLPLRPRAVSAWLRRAEEKPLEISLHGHQADVEALWRALGKPIRGPQGRRVFIVRMQAQVRAIACVPA